jgi:HAD superfamily hydrolase (TIGR01509 family)
MAESKLAIFDCDGVLVDSEAIACRVELAFLAELGHPIRPEEFRRQAVGRSFKDNKIMLEAMWGKALPADYLERAQAQTMAAFAAELQPVPGITAVLSALDARRCVASSSRLERVRRSLELTGLAHRFGANLFSAAQVERGKPAPDLFLYAARQMGAEPRDCVVIEDSTPGITAAKAAGMTALGFTAGGHCETSHGEQLMAAGADAVAVDAADLARLIEEFLDARTPKLIHEAKRGF